MEDFYGIFLLIIFTVLFFMPVLIAFSREHKNAIPILITTVSFGWTGIAWIILLAWSFSSNVKANEK